MSREIKFRGWDGQVMIEPVTGVNEFGHWWVTDREYEDGRFIKTGLMQYTGLKDKTGKEIYEGDIIKWQFVNTGDPDEKEYIEEVKWDECGFFLDGGAPLTVAMDDCEVIGNIWQNKDLLTL
jgi:uncharacterized phage protein (TIGR01671 family)